MSTETTELWDLLRFGNLNQLSPLFEADNDVLHQTDQGGNTPLHISSAWGFHDICRFLIRKGARVTAINSRGFTPLHWAAMNGHDSICAMLIEANSPIREDMRKQTPLHLACANGHIGVVNLLIMNGASLEVQDEKRKTPLDLVPTRKKELFQALIDGKLRKYLALQQNRIEALEEMLKGNNKNDTNN